MQQPAFDHALIPDDRDPAPSPSRDFAAALSMPRLPGEMDSVSRRRSEELRYARSGASQPQGQGTRLSLSSSTPLSRFRPLTPAQAVLTHPWYPHV